MPNVTFRIISVLPVGYYNSSCIAHLLIKKVCVDPRPSDHSITRAARCCALAPAANIDR